MRLNWLFINLLLRAGFPPVGWEKHLTAGKTAKELKMVYAVISDLDYPSGYDRPLGSVRLVKKGEISKPANVGGQWSGTYYHDEHYYSNYEDAKADIENSKKDWTTSPHRDGSRIQFSDEGA
jgi:hypothetical protein